MNMVQLIKKGALEAVEESKPVNIIFGTVTSVSPLRVTVEQKLTLERAFLKMTQRVSEYPLIPGDRVILLRKQGGQDYLILDKAVIA